MRRPREMRHNRQAPTPALPRKRERERASLLSSLSRLRAGLSHMEFSNRSSLRTQGPQRERKALIAAARALASALEQRPFFTFEARGYGSLRSQGRPAERLYEATTDQRTAQFSHICDSPALAGEGGALVRARRPGARMARYLRAGDMKGMAD